MKLPKPPPAPEPGIVFDREKFLAAVNFIIAECQEDLDRLGKTKLHKCLYYADMLSFIDRGEPVTGVDYLKEPFGPVARYLGWALKALTENGAISVESRPYYGLEKYDFKLAKPFKTNVLSEYEIKLLRTVIEFVCGFSAKEISEFSHAAPWQAVESGERIPYSSAYLLLPSRRPSRTDVEWGREALNLLRAKGT